MSLRSQKFNVYKWHKDIIYGCCENSAEDTDDPGPSRKKEHCSLLNGLFVTSTVTEPMLFWEHFPMDIFVSISPNHSQESLRL